jgi:hypothetical protein
MNRSRAHVDRDYPFCARVTRQRNDAIARDHRVEVRSFHEVRSVARSRFAQWPSGPRQRVRSGEVPRERAAAHLALGERDASAALGDLGAVEQALLDEQLGERLAGSCPRGRSNTLDRAVRCRRRYTQRLGRDQSPYFRDGSIDDATRMSRTTSWDRRIVPSANRARRSRGRVDPSPTRRSLRSGC